MDHGVPVLHGLEPVGTAFRRAELVVQAFGVVGRDLRTYALQDAVEVAADALGQFLPLRQVASLRPSDPPPQASFGQLRRQLPGALDRELELVRLRRPDVQVPHLQELSPLQFLQALGVGQPQELGLLQQLALPGLLDAYLVYRVVQQLDDVEVVEHQGRVGERILAPGDERGRQVQAH